MLVTDHFIYGGTIIGLPLYLMGIGPEIIVPVASLAGFSDAWPDIAPVRVSLNKVFPYLRFSYDWQTYGYWHFYYRGPIGFFHRIVDNWLHKEDGKWNWWKAPIGWLVTMYCILFWVSIF